MNLKEWLEQEQKQYRDIVSEMNELDKRKSVLLTAGVEIQGKIKLLNEMITSEPKPKE